ncbi:MAG: tetratricopeptide repeat protein [Bradymonadia bacterium]
MRTLTHRVPFGPGIAVFGRRRVQLATLLFAVVSGWSGGASGETIEDEFSALKAQVSSLESVYLAGVRREQGNRFESRMNDGQLFFYSKAYDRAAMIFLDLVDARGNQGRAGYGDAVFFLAESLYQVGNWAGAKRHFITLSKIGSQNHQQHALARLLDLAHLSGSRTLGREFASQAELSLRQKQSPMLLYAKGKHDYRANRLASSRRNFLRVPASAEQYQRAQYFVGVIAVREGKLDQAEAAFRKALGEETQASDSEESRVVRGQALLALARIAYEKSEFDVAVDLYNRVPRDSASFDEAMYELVWIAIKAKDYEKALRKLELLLISQSDVLDSSAARLLKGRLKLMLKDYDTAEQAFAEVSDAFGSIRKEMEQVRAKHPNLEAHFNRVVGDRIAEFDVRTIIPKKAAQIAGTDALNGDDLRLVADVAAQRRDVDQAKRNIKILETALSSDAQSKIFPKLHSGLLSAIELTTRLSLWNARLNSNSAKQARLNTPDFRVLRDERITWQRRLNNVPRSAATIQERTSRIQEKMSALDQAAHRLKVDLRGVEAQLVAMKKYIGDAANAGQKGPALANLRREFAEAKQVKAQIEALVDTIDREKLSVGISDAASANDEQIYVRFRDALARETQYLMERGLLRQRGLYDQSLVLYSQIQKFRSDAQRIIDERVAEYRAMLRSERSKLGLFTTELVQQESSTRALGGAIAARTFLNVLNKIANVVIEADIGMVNIAWKRKYDKSNEISKVVEKQGDELKRLQSLFNEVTGE